jgi:ABC-2 type transport system ATP-binding protein
MRQRLALGAALLGDPKVLILDEPANGLDPQGIRWLREFLRGFAARGNAVLVSSHVLTEMALLADEAIVINGGRLVRHAPMSELTSSTRAVRVRTTEPARLARVLQQHGIGVATDGDDGLNVSGTDTARVGTLAFETGVPVLELSEEQTTLEDVFLELTQEVAR